MAHAPGPGTPIRPPSAAPRARSGARGGGRPGDLPRLPDLSRLRQPLLAAVGSGAARRDPPRLRRVPHPDRASAAAAGRARAGAVRGRGRALVHRALLRGAGRARRRDVPAGPARGRSGRRVRGRRAAAVAVQLRPAGVQGLSGRAVLRVRRVGDGAGGRAPETRWRGVVAARARGAAAPGGVAARRPLRALARERRRAQPRPRGAARAGGARAVDGARLRGHGQPAVLDPAHGRARGGAAAGGPVRRDPAA